MKASTNKVALEGKAGKDAKITPFDNGGKVARVSIAVNDTFKNREGEDASRTLWFNLVFWNEKVALAEKIKKGTSFSVEGKLSSQKYPGKQGQTIYATEVNVESLKILAK